jgi:hypothetical protein
MKIQVTLQLTPSPHLRDRTFLSIRTLTGIISSLLFKTYTRLISALITSTFPIGKIAASTIVEGNCNVTGTGLVSLKSKAKILLEWDWTM